MYQADQSRISMQRNNRSGDPLSTFVWHHQASTNNAATIEAMVSGSRQVSANWTIDNDNPAGRGWATITEVVPEQYRAWTSASWIDDVALTVECANLSGNPDWAIADSSFEAAARLAAYAYLFKGVPLRRSTPGDLSGHMRHDEVEALTGQGYSTFCCGHLDLDRVIARAAQLIGTPSGDIGGGLNPTPVPEYIPLQEDDMPQMVLKPGESGVLPNPYKTRTGDRKGHPDCDLWVSADNPTGLRVDLPGAPGTLVEGVGVRIAVQNAGSPISWRPVNAPGFPGGEGEGGLLTNVGLGSSGAFLADTYGVSVVNRGFVPITVLLAPHPEV